MDVAKRLYQNLGPKLVFVYLSLFPLGQLLKVPMAFGAISFSVNTLDILAMSSLFLNLFGTTKKPKFFKHIEDFLLISLFSLIFSLFIFTPYQVLPGTLYFIRFISYISFFILVWNLVGQKLMERQVLLKGLIAASFFTAFFGWIQYIWLPDLTWLKYYGWDDHLFRLVGTFLDPAFTSIIIAFGTLISLTIYTQRKEKKYLATFIFLLITLVFTYARASYLALFFGIFTLLFLRKKTYFKYLYLTIFVFFATLLFLPRVASEGTLLERTQSIFAKLENYSETFEIIKRYPVFGVGFNNMCLSRTMLFGGETESHACSGSDSSLLLVIAATGIVGFFVFTKMLFELLKNVPSNLYGIGFLICAVALFVHSFFVNSFFYPWVLGWMGILLAISIKNH